MKKITALVLTALIAFILACSLAACSNTGVCESCGQNEQLKQFTHDDGRVEWVCNDCYRMYKLFYS